MPRLIVCLVAAAAAFDACTQKDAQGRRPLRCCPGKPSYVVAILHGERKDGRLQQIFEDIIRVEKKFYGDWSKETRQLLADGDALAAYKRRAFDLYRQRFAPEALLRRVDAWNERGAPDDWQDS